MNAEQQKVVQYLNEAEASERALVRVLQSQIAMTPRGSYRSALETHLDETRRHGDRLATRLQALDHSGDPLGAVLGVIDTSGGGEPSARGSAAVLRVFPVALPLSMISGGFAVYLLTRRFARRPATGSSRVTYALGGAPAHDVALGATTGALLALLLVLVSVLAPVGNPEDQGLLAKVLAASGTGRLIFGLTAILLAPPVEEYVFRGVLLGTLLPMGEVAAGVLSGLAFWLLHVTEWIHYWPAAVGVGAMTVLVTLLRLRTRSILPSIFAHLFYNGALTLVALFS